MGGGDNAGGGPKKIGGGRTGAVGEGAGFELAALRSRGHAPSAVATPLPRGHAPSAVATPPWRLSCRAVAARGSVAERSKALDLGSSPRGDVGSNPTAANRARRPLLRPPPLSKGPEAAT